MAEWRNPGRDSKWSPSCEAESVRRKNGTAENAPTGFGWRGTWGIAAGVVVLALAVGMWVRNDGLRSGGDFDPYDFDADHGVDPLEYVAAAQLIPEGTLEDGGIFNGSLDFSDAVLGDGWYFDVWAVNMGAGGGGWVGMQGGTVRMLQNDGTPIAPDDLGGGATQDAGPHNDVWSLFSVPNTGRYLVLAGSRGLGSYRVSLNGDFGAASSEEYLGLGQEAWRSVQAGLAAEGFSPGATDGVPGSATREALRRWQGSQGLQESGYLDGAQVAALETVGAAKLAREEAAPAAELRRPGQEFRDCGVCPEMVVLPTGSYRMGSPPGETGRSNNEAPMHTVRISYPLAVGKYEVMFEEWDACVAAEGCGGHQPNDEGWGRGERPVINVDWDDAWTYVRWLSRETGERYRLLSEAEWEYAARAGTATARHWGEGESGQCGYANGYDEVAHDELAREDTTAAACRDGYVRTAPVGTFGSNGWGLYDMLGNVQEWTADCWHDGGYDGAPSDGSAWLSGGECSYRVLRGGSWENQPRRLRSADRSLQVGYRNDYSGFRVARTMN